MAERHPTDMTTTVFEQYPNGGCVVVFNSIDRETDDFRRILSCAKHFARQGKTAVMTPKLNVPYKNPAYDKIYGTLKGTPYYGKCPDLCVDGAWYEHEGYIHFNPKTNFANMCRRGFRQSSRIIVEDCGLTDGYMFRSIEGQLRAGIKIVELWVRTLKECRLVYKLKADT